MPGKEIKGRSKIATYRNGGRVKAADGLWANIHAKRAIIKAVSGEKIKRTGPYGEKGESQAFKTLTTKLMPYNFQ